MSQKKRTTVVNVRHAPPGTFTYVGRAVRGRFPASPWGNAFRGEDWRERYRAHVLSNPCLVVRLPELRGKSLGCWCCDSTERPADPADYTCHAQILAELADGPLGNPPGRA
jgi:hypothetical protein